MKLKKMLCVILAALFCMAVFAGCSGDDSESEAGEKLEIGIVQIEDHLSLNQIRDSIISEIEAQGYGDRVDIECQNANGSNDNVNTICQKFVGDGKDLIIAIATPTAQAAARAAGDIPVIFSAVTDPVAANLVNSLEAPGGNVTGTSDIIPVDEIFRLASEMTPDATNFGFLYNSGEVNSVSVIEEAKAYCDANGLTYTEATLTNTSEVQQAVQSLIGSGVDAIFTPIDNTVAKAMEIVKNETIKAQIPVYPGADSMVIDGGLATVGIDYEVLGQKTAQMVIDVLFNGKTPGEIPVESLESFSAIINKTTAEAIGVEIPPDRLDSATIVE